MSGTSSTSRTATSPPRMILSRREKTAAAAAGALVVGLVVAILLDSWQWSLALLGALTLSLAGVILMTLRRQDGTRADALERIERKVDNLALRVVTESQATHRELSSLIEELGKTLRGSETKH